MTYICQGISVSWPKVIQCFLHIYTLHFFLSSSPNVQHDAEKLCNHCDNAIKYSYHGKCSQLDCKDRSKAMYQVQVNQVYGASGSKNCPMWHFVDLNCVFWPGYSFFIRANHTWFSMLEITGFPVFRDTQKWLWKPKSLSRVSDQKNQGIVT